MHNTTSFSPIIQLPMQLDKIKRLNNFVVICQTMDVANLRDHG